MFGSETCERIFGDSVCHRRKGTTESVHSWFVLVTNAEAAGWGSLAVLCAGHNVCPSVRSLFSAHVSLLIPQISDLVFV
jgi:hypothetical protein